MKGFLLILLLLNINLTWANELKVEVAPNRPVAGEVFQVFFRIFTESGDEPNITFTPGSLEVVGKANQGISTRTVYANGKLTVTREITITYELIAPRVGNSYLRDIKVEVDGQVLRHPTIVLSVLKEPEEIPPLFVQADVPKKNLFIGEGVIVRYFLYSKVPINAVDIKKYPKLNHFLKRFLQEPDRSERVSVNGEVYLRTQIYAAKLFPESSGELKVDSLELTATYPVNQPGDPFASFGMGRSLKTKTFTSPAVKVQVIPLPQPAPAHFTGLVGKHDFQLQFGQTKLIVNEPLELKLTVTGGGALENLEAPKFFENSALEEFESNGDLKITSADEATKIFDYTYLTRENIKIPGKTFVLHYFDPSQQRYVPVNVSLPEVEVAGGVRESKKGNADNAVAKTIKKEALDEDKKQRDDKAGPVLNYAPNFKAWLPYFNALLAVISVLIALGWLMRSDSFSFGHTASAIPTNFKKGKFSLSEFTKWLSPLVEKTGKSPHAVIRESNLEGDTKNYFIALLNANDYKDYSGQKGKLDFTYHAGHFKKLASYIKSIKDENPSEPT
jgi:hypothetical protein